MSASVNFPCPACGAKFALTELIAGRRMQCTCGKIFVAPPILQAIEDPQSPDPQAYEMAEHCEQSLGGKAEVPAQEEVLASYARLYPQRRARPQAVDDAETEYSPFRDRVIPIAMLVSGVALRLAEIPYDRTLGHSNFAAGVGILLMQMILAVALMLAGVLIASRFLSVNFGPVGTAILKMAGVCMFSLAVGALVVVALQYEVRSYVIAIQIVFLIYSVAFWKLFSLDVQEAVLTVAICAFLQNAVLMVIFLSA